MFFVREDKIMKKSILIELLSKFSIKETKEFSEYISSPFFNKNQSIIKLYSYLRLQYPLFEKENIEKKAVFQRIFPNVKYNDGFMRTLIFGLCTLAENYLSYTRYKSSYFRDKTFLLYELNDRQVDRLLEKNIKSFSKKLDSVIIKDNEYYYDKYNFENEKYLFYFRKKPDVFEKIIKETDLTGMIDYMTCSYISTIIGDYTRLFNLKNIYEFDFDFSKFEKFYNIIKDERYNSIPCVIVSYYELMLFIKNDDLTVFYELKKLLGEYEHVLDKDHVYNIYVNLINYCNRNIRNGHQELQREVFEIYKQGLESKILPYHGTVHFRFYTTVAETALNLSEFEWTQNFINNYKDHLPEDIRENTFNYANAMYEFAAGNFGKSLEILSRISYNDVYHKIKCKCLLAMLYYELRYNDQLLSHIDSFNHFIINDRFLNKERKKNYSNFIRFVKKIERIRQYTLIENAEELKKKINADIKLYYKDWLLKKIAEIKQ